MAHEVTVRQYGEAGDYQLVADWFSKRRDGEQFPEMCLPPHGVIASVDGEPTAALWVYLSFGIGVAHVHWAIGRPGVQAWVLTAAFKAALGWAADVCRAHNSFLLFTTVRKDLARILERLGFQHGGDHVFMSKALI